MKEFRLKVLLHDFFLDYRRASYVYISKDIKIIQDLINYISLRFDISSKVYLTSDNVYLPHFEDIRILEAGDPILVTPLAIAKKKRSKPSVENEINITPNRSKRIIETKQNSEQEDQISMIVDGSDGEDCTDSIMKLPKKLKKRKKSKLEQHESLEPTAMSKSKVVVQKGSTMDLSSCTQKEETVALPVANVLKPIRVAEAVVAEFTRRKKVELLPISTIPKLVTPSFVHANSDKISVAESETSSSDESEVSQVPVVVESDATNPIQSKKRKRKRVRTRKPKPDRSLIPPLPLALPIPMPVECASRLHIRFDKPDEVSTTETLTNGTGTEEVVAIDSKKPEVNCGDLSEIEILRFPVMQGVEPKVNDIIAFKRFMLSEDYTPEISNFIVASVQNYSPSTSTIVIKVLEGKEHCDDPKGKFYIEEDQNNSQNNQELQFTWSELIEPRLLYP